MRPFKITYLHLLGGLLAILLLMLSIYLNWQLSMSNSYTQITQVTRQISNRFDAFIEDLLQDVYALPMDDKDFTNCKSGLFASVEHININSPIIAGLMISDSYGTVTCSTLPKSPFLQLSSPRSRALSGPFVLPFFDSPVYLIQQKMGNYRIGLVIVASVLENRIKPTVDMVDAIVLYDNYLKKNIMNMVRVKNSQNWQLSQKTKLHSPMKAKESVQSIEGLSIIAYARPQIVLRQLILRQIIANGLLILLASMLYFLIKNAMIRHYSLERAMKSALKNEDFYPSYQAVYDVQTGHYLGAEVLLRWQDQSAVIMPDFFIQEAETNGLIVPITLVIIKKAFQESKTLFKLSPDFHLAFNLSAQHFKDSSFFPKFYQLVEEYSILPSQVLLEITERDLFDTNDGVFLKTMQELRSLGYSLAIDDYGTGHASISYLQYFPFNYLKIDKLFIQAIGTKAITESLNYTIIEMAKKLQLTVIAEGVETHEQFDYLKKQGIRFQQGWYFTKALSMDNLLKLINGE